MSNSRRPKNPQLGRPQQQAKGTPLIVALVVLLCIGGVVAIAVTLSGSNSGTSAGTSPTGSAADSSAAPSSAATSSIPGLSCTAAPAVPGSPQQFSSPPDPSLAQSSTWVATVKTNCGTIELKLDGARAPQTVASFIFLAQKGFFANSPCQRLTTSGIFVLQCGDPTGSGSGDPGYGYGIENAPPNGDYPTGTLAMARTSDPNTNGSQFFIVYKDTQLPTTGGGYSIFGEVTRGLDIVDKLAQQGVTGGGADGAPAQPISILGVSVAKK